MAGKQLGKLRQWAGEVISSREKTQPSSEFIAMEREMDLRRAGVDRLRAVSDEYLLHLNAKIKSAALASSNEVPHSEAFGEVFVDFGEGLNSESSLGRAMIAYGRAHHHIATLQSIYALCLRDAFISFLQRAADQLDALADARKRLESRRLAYDAALSKAEKNFKKEKDRREAEREVDDAKDNYEEVADEVKEMMEGVKAGEVEFQRELKSLLGVEMNYISQYLEVLKNVEAEWPIPNTHSDLKKQTPQLATLHNFSRTSMRSTESKDSGEPTAHHSPVVSSAPPPLPSRFNSLRSNGSSHSRKASAASSPISSRDAETSEANQSDAEEDEASKAKPLSGASVSRKNSTKSSRSQKSKGTRSRSASVATARTTGTGELTDDTAQTSKSKKSKHVKEKSGVASWVGGAMSSVMARNKAAPSPAKNADVENFSALADDEEDRDSGGSSKPRSRRFSNRSTKSARSDKGKDNDTKADFAEERKKRRVMRALHDFDGSDSMDELSFRAGEEIIVVHAEVRDGDWWLGELATTGRRGLFPANYTVEVKQTGSGFVRSRNASASSILGLGRSTTPKDTEEEESRVALVSQSRESLESESSEEGEPITMHANVHDTGGTESDTDAASMDDYWQPVTNQLLAARPVPSPQTSFLTSSNATFSGTTDSDSDSHAISNRPRVDTLSPSLATGSAQSLSPSEASSAKRFPPPPPPRRPSQSRILGIPPPLPSRSVSGAQPQSGHSPSRSQSNPLLVHLAAPIGPRRTHSETPSPFESQSDFSSTTDAGPGAVGTECMSCDCREFIEDPFRGQGLCAQCTHAHW